MIEIYAELYVMDKLRAWLESTIKPQLKADVSSYARGRRIAWLRFEPMLFKPYNIIPGIPISDKIWNRLAELIQWPFDFCLVTYSGDGENGIGIQSHRDAGYADYEAVGLNVNGDCEFRYWQESEGYGYSAYRKQLNPDVDAPTHILQLKEGYLFRFNCKNPHAALPGLGRWGMNFWRKKPYK